MRAPYQVLVFPYTITDNSVEYAIFKRSDYGYWQGLAGGGEEGETPIESAKREAFEEAGITRDHPYIELDSMSSLPVEDVVGNFLWGEDVYVLKEFSFGVKVPTKDISLSKEHLHYKWLCFEEAVTLLKWDSNKTALWELNKRLLHRLNTKQKFVKEYI
ncbi:NUDIX pyrophosphatase [Lysinibacillus sphaericus]|uniref:Cytochrome C biogenesis protein CcdA n=2 Tax=Lysinibacillus TaxID=400634 RepID=W7RNL5_LYSSH|nr:MULTISPECIES: NUDIX pyrophosphatase [Lysinibacillus]MBE5083169.1 NUDIX pyrophosphatase [Bacillus thuringiensis]AMO33781.1 NUDIX pyrophosphatase [Lysinibacillus sphaericus]AMR91110.1 NUDIX pyrophosphatase [Lysinibacillus sphaericus]ANA45159.1 NUDIX pyrophosphatase [Lysinibacillus sphaericus]EWH32199.1 cytochrome C biogenesis protein CcdA [Lysinibacillus sphaericus CBAM5]